MTMQKAVLLNFGITVVTIVFFFFLSSEVTELHHLIDPTGKVASGKPVFPLCLGIAGPAQAR